MMFLRCNFMDKFELVKFTDNNFEINVRADIDNDTVWLTQKKAATI